MINKHDIHNYFVLVISVKEGVPSEEELESLSQCIGLFWRKLGRRLKFDEAKLTGFDKDNEEFSEKAYKMLLAWKQGDGQGATYKVLYNALCAKLVAQRELAEEFCLQTTSNC